MARALTFLAAGLAAANFAAPPASLAQDSETAFFQNKTVRIIVGFGAGGGYDIYARTIAPYIAKNLGSSVSVVVENQPGAGGLTALNRIYTAAPDGLQMMLVNGTGGTVYLGNSGVTTTTGYALAASSAVYVGYGEFAPQYGGTPCSLYGITASGTSSVTVYTFTTWPGAN